jgi:hypothetical protein
MCGKWAVGIDMLQTLPHYDCRCNRRRPPQPQENNARHRPPIMLIHQRSLSTLFELRQQALRCRGICTSYICRVCSQYNSQRQGRGQREYASEDGADAPCEFDGRGFEAFGPEKVEEEGGAEDGRDVDAVEDVVAGDADDVVIVDGGAGGVLRYPVLLVDVVWVR